MIRPVFLALCLAVLFCQTALAEELSAGKMLSFADSLFERGDYYRAITEYERVIFFYPGHPLATTAQFQIAHSYLKGERFDQAIERFRILSTEHPDDEAGRKASFMLGESYYRKREYERAEEVFLKYIETYPLDPQADAARIRAGWSCLRQGRWQEAEEEFRKLPPGSPLRVQAEGLAEGSRSYPDIPKKSPALAGGLSAVLPGAGQLYIDRPADAAVSFLLNGAFIWATVEAFRNDNSVTGGILLFFESGWYLGNIYNAVSGAHKYNRRSEQRFMDGLEDRYRVSYRFDGHRGGTVALTMRF